MPDRTIAGDTAATIAYLRFPLRADDRGGLRDGSACPYCRLQRIQKWGRFAGRQRFRCRDCARTFSTFTGTPLRYLKRVDRWRAFLWCMEGRLTVRRTGAVVGIDSTTALRWRHRVLDHWRLEPHRRLRGSVVVGEFWMPPNEKGSRRLQRPPRQRGQAPGHWCQVTERVGLIGALETGGGAPGHWIGCTNARRLDRSDIESLLAPRLGYVREIVGYRGPLCALAWFAGIAGAEYRRARGGSPAEGIPELRLALRRWLRPLRGVATRRLGNYLEWFRRCARPGRWQAAARVPTRPADRARGDGTTWASPGSTVVGRRRPGAGRPHAGRDRRAERPRGRSG